MDPDIAAAISKQLGIQLQFKNQFDGLITSLNSKRIELDHVVDERHQGPPNEVDKDGKKAGPTSTSWTTSTRAPRSSSRRAAPRGSRPWTTSAARTVALQKGTTQEEMANKQQEKCAAASKGKIDLLTFDKDTDALLQLEQGRSVADMNDFPVAAYNAQTANNGNDFEVVGEQLEAGPYGVALRKDDTQLRDVVKEALENIVKSGEYTKILEARKLTQGAVTQIAVNGG
ncbi:ABC transporter substrate-binding protein [Yinghuangia aomiensis]